MFSTGSPINWCNHQYTDILHTIHKNVNAMEGTILFQLIQSLNALDRQSLRKYLRSPYHNKRDDLLALFACFDTAKPPTFDRENIFQHIYPGQAFDVKQFNHLLSFLTQQIEAWLALEQAQADTAYWDTCLVRAYRLRGLTKHQHRVIRSAEKKLEATPYRHAGHYRAKMQLQQETLLPQQGRAKELPLKALSAAQDIALIAEKLRMGCLLASHRNLTRKDYDLSLLEALLTFLPNHPYLEVPTVGAYYHGYLAQTAVEPEGHFRALVIILEQYSALFPTEELHDLYLIAINFCIKKVNLGGEAWFVEIFQLYRRGLQAGIFLENGQLSRWTFNNIVSTSIRVSELAWAKSFMADYAPKLAPAVRQASVGFNLARVLYEERNYPAALDALHQMEHDDILEVFNAKILRMKIFYHIKEWKALDSLLESITAHIRRNKVLGYHKENFANTVGAMRKLLALNPYDAAARDAFRQTVAGYKVLSERQWFLTQAGG